MKTFSKLSFIIPVVGFSIINAVGSFPHKTLVEVVCLWILPLIYVYLLLRSNMSIKARLGYLVIMILCLWVAEAIGIFLAQRTPIPTPMSDWQWYSYRTIYAMVGIIQFIVLAPLIVTVSSKRMNAIIANGITGVLLVLYGWLSTSALADYRPLLISKQLPFILALFAVVGYLFYRILKLRMSLSYSVILAVIISFIFLYPTIYSSGM